MEIIGSVVLEQQVVTLKSTSTFSCQTFTLYLQVIFFVFLLISLSTFVVGIKLHNFCVLIS